MTTGNVEVEKLFLEMQLPVQLLVFQVKCITNYSNAFSIQAGDTLNLHSYLLGDVDGDYAGLLI